MSYHKMIHISERGQVVIPKEIRNSIGLSKSNRLKIKLLDDGNILLEPIRGFALELAGSAKGLLRGEDVHDYIAGLRADRS